MFGFMNKDYDMALSAYTLAEMLLVLLIISIVLIALPLSTKKLFTVKEIKSDHGRFECYWDDSSGTNVLKYYYAKERQGLSPLVEEGELTGTKCEFTPPATYPYIILHAVGGGGAGGNLSTAVGSTAIATAYYDYEKGLDAVWPAWFVKFINSVHANNSLKTQYHIDDGSANEKTIYPTNIIVRQIVLKYRKNGAAGQIASMFFPFIPSGKKFYLYPGKGGELKAENANGESGGNSVVQVISGDTACDVTDANASCNVIFAKGGAGGTVLGSDGNPIDLSTTVQLHGGKSSDYGISNYSDVKKIVSGFSEIIDKVNKTESLSTRIAANAGDGGNGANHYAKNSRAGLILHEFDNYEGTSPGTQGVNWVSISRYISKSVYEEGSGTCENKTSGLETANGGALWIKRSKYNVSAQCYPYPYDSQTPTYYYCSAGNFNRTSGTLACKASGRCVNYKYNADGSSVSLVSGSATPYRNPVIHIDSTNPKETYFEIEEHIASGSSYISCASVDGYDYSSTPCSSGSTDFDSTKGICKASKGGNGAIVILW